MKGRLSRKFVIARSSLILLGVSAFLVFAPLSIAQKKKIPPTPAPPPATPSPAAEHAIELPQIVDRAEELDKLLNEMDERLASDPAVNSIDQSLRAQEGLIRARQREVDELIAAAPTLMELNQAEQDWQATRSQFAGWRKILAERAEAVEADLRLLADQLTQWQATLDQSRGTDAIPAVLDRIHTALDEIQSMRAKANERLTTLVTLQNRVSQQDQVVTDVLEKISREEERLQRSLLERDSPPLWEASSLELRDQVVAASLRRSFSGAITRAVEFLKSSRQTVSAIFIFFIGAIGINLLLRQRIIDPNVEQPGRAAKLFQYPISLALLFALIVALPLSSAAPELIKSLLFLLFMIPVLRFLPALIGPAIRPMLYLLVGFGLAAGIWEILAVRGFLKREGMAVLSIATIAMGAWSIRPARIRSLRPSIQRAPHVSGFLRATLLLIGASLIANIFGYVGLSRILRSGTIHSALFAVILYTAFSAITALVSRLLGRDRVHLPSNGQTHWEMIAKWGSLMLSTSAFLIWLYASLNFFGIRDRVLGALSSVLTSPIRLRAINFSLGDILTFVLVFVLGVIFANIIRAILQIDVLMRLPLKRGLPYAISTITYYLLLLAVFLMALAASGVELSRFTLLTGAFGVGAGFGLQNIINNFVSGIILLFERPIRIGDSLEVGNIAGDVQRIGMRSTTLRTGQGAEVILPNSALISGQVTNWTLGQPQRRVELKVEVPSDADPERIINLLVDVAASHPDVLSDPRPVAFLVGFGSKTLNYELHFWVPQAPMLMRVRSELGVKIAAALQSLDRGSLESGVRSPESGV
jgi:potassium-dependent mechanosensitive channel